MTKITQITLYGKEFNVEKRAGEWQTNYRDAKATVGISKATAISNLKELDKTKVIAGCQSVDGNITRGEYFKAHTEEFTQIFGFTPPRDFLLYHFGCGLSLDVIKLDEKLRTPDGISTNDYIKQLYGETAVNMVLQMI